jgi:hypothetical protein
VGIISSNSGQSRRYLHHDRSGGWQLRESSPILRSAGVYSHRDRRISVTEYLAYRCNRYVLAQQITASIMSKNFLVNPKTRYRSSEQNKLSRESHYYPFLHTPQPTPLFPTDITNQLLARAHDVCHKSHLIPT